MPGFQNCGGVWDGVDQLAPRQAALFRHLSAHSPRYQSLTIVNSAGRMVVRKHNPVPPQYREDCSLE